MISKQRNKINNSITKVIFFSLLIAGTLNGKAQDDILVNKEANGSKTTLSLKAYIDVFYAYDFNKPISNIRVPYMVNHNRHNEFNLNIGAISTSIQGDRYHAKLILQAGTYAIDNYANENEVMRIVNEANIGVALTKNKKLWLDAGILNSHIGFEALDMIDGVTLTRSLMVENIPYYLAGAKLTYTFNEKWSLLAMVTNGWQRIKRVEGNSLMSYSTNLSYSPSNKLQFGWNTFIGTDDPDSTRRMRYFNEIFATIIFNNKWTLKTGYDYGIQQESKGSNQYEPWFLASVMTQYAFHKHWALGLRGEFASDKYRIVIDNPTPNDFILWGLSGNLDYKPIKNVMARIEGRYWFSENQIFVKNDSFVSDDLFITFALVIQFGKDFKI